MDIRKNQQQTRSLFSSTAVSNTSLSPSCGSDLLWIQEQTHCLESPFPDDPLCKLNLMETSDFVKSLPLHNISPARTHYQEQQQKLHGCRYSSLYPWQTHLRLHRCCSQFRKLPTAEEHSVQVGRCREVDQQQQPFSP